MDTLSLFYFLHFSYVLFIHPLLSRAEVGVVQSKLVGKMMDVSNVGDEAAPPPPVCTLMQADEHRPAVLM